ASKLQDGHSLVKAHPLKVTGLLRPGYQCLAAQPLELIIQAYRHAAGIIRRVCLVGHCRYLLSDMIPGVNSILHIYGCKVMRPILTLSATMRSSDSFRRAWVIRPDRTACVRAVTVPAT